MNEAKEGLEDMKDVRVVRDDDSPMSVDITELRVDLDLEDPLCVLRIASERLSIVRYVFLVQIEEGIASAAQRASLEYADAVLIEWPDPRIHPEVRLTVPDERGMDEAHRLMEQMEGYIARFCEFERDGDVDGMTDTLIRVTERVAKTRLMFQPDYALPTFAEIRRVVQDEWDEDMGRIDAGASGADGTADTGPASDGEAGETA